MITSSQLIEYVNGSERPDFGDSNVDTAYADQCVQEAEDVLASINVSENVPTSLYDRATLEVAAELYGRKGVGNFGTQGPSFDRLTGALRQANDPRTMAIKILRKWVSPW